MCSLEKRPRIPYQPKRLLPVEDELAYTRNRCSSNAKRIDCVKSSFECEVWIDKHYQIRKQFGDESGARDGIDQETVKSLVLRSLKHLIAYSSILKTFTFINHELNGGRASRIVLQESSDKGMLNVVIEAHFVDVDNCEITVITAMCMDNFKLSDGQFAVEIVENESVIRKMEKGQIKEIYNL